MDSQKITLALPRQLLRRAKVVAMRRETSISALVAVALEEAVRANDLYEPAMQRVLVRARAGYELGSNGQLGIDRDELHER